METIEANFNALREPLDDLLDAYRSNDHGQDDEENNPELIHDAFDKLFVVMEKTRHSGEEVSEVGEYAMALFDQALQWAERLKMQDAYNTIQEQTISMAHWIASNHGQLYTLEMVVNAFSQKANQTLDPGELLALCSTMGEVVRISAATIQQDLEKSNPGRPWRILNLNRAIVATRTHQPDIMEEAFTLLTTNLPEEAAAFFAQGMEQMDLLDYPPHVREIMSRYHKKWNINRSLH